MSVYAQYPTDSLPLACQAALRRAGYKRDAIAVGVARPGERVTGGPSGDGRRSFAVVFDCATGAVYQTLRGSFGGSNPWQTASERACDDDRAAKPLTDYGATAGLIRGSDGYGGVYAQIALPLSAFETLAPPPGSKVQLNSEDEARALRVVATIRGGARKDEWHRERLPGEYSGTHPLIRALAERDLVKVNRAGSVTVTTAGRNAARAQR